MSGNIALKTWYHPRVHRLNTLIEPKDLDPSATYCKWPAVACLILIKLTH